MAGNTFVKKAEAPLSPVVGIAAGTAVSGLDATTPGYIPTAFTSFGTPGTVGGDHVLGQRDLTAAKPTANSPARSRSWSTARATGKVTRPGYRGHTNAGPDGLHGDADHGAAEGRPHRRDPVRGREKRHLHAEELEPCGQAKSERPEEIPATETTGTAKAGK